ncbi:MAG: hypothetical protein KF716_11530 [Anaerolineae bacterium]|nr:hypothetical protein [Anaerolineae bacterium]
MTTRNLFWLRLSYWLGAFIDLVAAIQMLVPSVFAATNNLPDFHPSIEYEYAMRMGASLMLGWTLLLIWAAQKPIERKGVLGITVFPVIFGLILNEVIAVQAQFIPITAMIPVWVLQAVLVLLFTFSYMNA